MPEPHRPTAWRRKAVVDIGLTPRTMGRPRRNGGSGDFNSAKSLFAVSSRPSRSAASALDSNSRRLRCSYRARSVGCRTLYGRAGFAPPSSKVSAATKAS